MTDLDDLKQLWGDLDRKLETSLQLNRRLLASAGLERARSALGSLRWSLALELVGNAVALVALGAFAAANPVVRFAAPAVVLAVGALALVHAQARQLVAARIDPGAPVAIAQRQLEQLRRLRVTTGRWTLLLAPVAWPPLAIVALKALCDVDAWVAPGVAWLAANLAFGIAALWVAWRLSARANGRFAAVLSGRSVAAAVRALDAITELERSS